MKRFIFVIAILTHSIIPFFSHLHVRTHTLVPVSFREYDFSNLIPHNASQLTFQLPRAAQQPLPRPERRSLHGAHPDSGRPRTRSAHKSCEIRVAVTSPGVSEPALRRRLWAYRLLLTVVNIHPVQTRYSIANQTRPFKHESPPTLGAEPAQRCGLGTDAGHPAGGILPVLGKYTF